MVFAYVLVLRMLCYRHRRGSYPLTVTTYDPATGTPTERHI